MKSLFKSEIVREFLGEFIGMTIMMSYGLSGCASNILSGANSPFVAPVSFGFGVIFAMISCVPISGAHVNPIFSIALATIGRLPVWKLGHYFAGQFLGSFVGSAIVYLLYFQNIQAFDTKLALQNNSTIISPSVQSAAIFITSPAPHVSLPIAMFDQIFMAALIVFSVLFIVDQKIYQTPFALQVLLIGGTVISIGVATSFNCGAIFNPARDLSPRVLLYFLGYDKIVFSALNGHFWWAVGIVATSTGGAIGAIVFYFVEQLRDYPKSEKTEFASGKGSGELPSAA